MVITLFIWVYIWFVLSSLGLVFHYISSKILRNNIVVATISPTQTVFNGFCMCMGICSILHFVINIGLLAHICVFICAVSSCFLLKQRWKFLIITIKKIVYSLNFSQKLMIVSTLFALLLGAVSLPTNIDSGNYHAQAIQWINNFKIIPGLGNILGHLAYNQSSFFVEAFFSFSFLGYSPFRGLNGFMAFMMIVSIITCLNFNKIKAGLNHLIGVTIIIFFLLHYKDWLSSPTPDIISALMTYYVLWLSLQRVLSEKPINSDYKLITIFFISISALTVKLSVVTLPLVALVLIISTPNFFKSTKFRGYIFLGFLVLAPWFIRNVVLSGYLIFPLSSIDLFNYDWKIPKVMVESIKDAIQMFAINHSLDWVDLMKLSKWDRMMIWFEKTSWFRISLLIIVLISQIIYLVKIIYWRKWKKYEKDLFFLNSSIFIGIVFWFLNAPDFRFGSAFIYTYVAIVLFTFIPKSIKTNRFFLMVLSGLALLFVLRKLKVEDIKEYAVIPAQYVTSKVVSHKTQGFRYFVPKKNNQCWNYDAPCIPFGNLSNVVLRGDKIEDGFKYQFPVQD